LVVIEADAAASSVGPARPPDRHDPRVPQFAVDLLQGRAHEAEPFQSPLGAQRLLEPVDGGERRLGIGEFLADLPEALAGARLPVRSTRPLACQVELQLAVIPGG
jgi:hypothetical protein